MSEVSSAEYWTGVAVRISIHAAAPVAERTVSKELVTRLDGLAGKTLRDSASKRDIPCRIASISGVLMFTGSVG